MSACLLDSGILIRHLRRIPGFLELLQQLNQAGDLYISDACVGCLFC